MITCSGDESFDAEESRVVEETLGANAETENGLCQFITIPFTDPLIKKHFPSSFLPNNKTASVLCHWQHSPGTINSLSYHHSLVLEFSFQTEAERR